ncbi:MAG TPA: OmpH family outer membrane protein [Nitrospiraceae bacterium]|nr:OmpH family outer membrane protein [Nitrospiraceae bacterium]
MNRLASGSMRPWKSLNLRRMLRCGVCLIGLAACGCAATPANQAGVRVGVLDPQRVFAETTAGKKAQDSLNAFIKNRQALIELEEKDLKRMEEDLMRQASVLSANARKEREDQFRRRAMEFQQKAQELNREVQDKQKEVLEGFRGKVEKAVEKVAQQLGLQVVLEKSRGSGTVYSEPSLDITQKVIEEFNKAP